MGEREDEGGKVVAGSTSGVAWRGSVGRKGVGRAWGAGESAALQYGKCCAFTGLTAFAASVGFLPVALLIVMQQFDCSC